MTHVIKPLTSETFPAWLALAEKHNGTATIGDRASRAKLWMAPSP